MLDTADRVCMPKRPVYQPTGGLPAVCWMTATVFMWSSPARGEIL